MTSLNDITADLRRESFNQYGRKISSTDSVSNHFERLRTKSVLCHPPPDVDANISGSISNVTFVLPESINLSEDEVKYALMSEVKKHKSWRVDAVKRMRITRILTTSAIRYSLQSFLETRKTYEACESSSAAYEFGSFSDHGNSSDPWDYICEPRKLFAEDEIQIELPGTSRTSECTTCSGHGSNHCFHCRGTGTSRCGACNGTGMKNGVPHPAIVTHPLVGGYAHDHSSSSMYCNKSSLLGSNYAKGTPAHFASISGLPPPGVTAVDLCIMCHGTGIRQCHYCKGSGKKTCGLCGGSGSVRTCTKMKIKYSLASDEFINEPALPVETFKYCTGDILFIEMKERVSPLRGCPIAAINDQSIRLINAHTNNSIDLSRIIQQRQMVESIPVTEVNYSLGGRAGVFWVLGNEKTAYISRYPQKCVVL